jgi:hypothetical protein
LALECRGIEQRRLRFAAPARDDVGNLSSWLVRLQRFDAGGQRLELEQLLAILALARQGGAKLEFLPAVAGDEGELERSDRLWAWPLMVLMFSLYALGAAGTSVLWNEHVRRSDEVWLLPVALLAPLLFFEAWTLARMRGPKAKVGDSAATLWVIGIILSLIGMVIGAVVLGNFALDGGDRTGKAQLAFLLASAWLPAPWLPFFIHSIRGFRASARELRLFPRVGQPLVLSWDESAALNIILERYPAGVLISQRLRRQLCYALQEHAQGRDPVKALQSQDQSGWPLAPKAAGGWGSPTAERWRIALFAVAAGAFALLASDAENGLRTLSLSYVCVGWLAFFVVHNWSKYGRVRWR